jgi:hypothetical protein
LRKARIVKRNKQNGAVPEVVGGREAPVTSFNRRRAFGLRALGAPSVEFLKAIRDERL